MGLGEHDNAVMVDVIGAMPRAKKKQSRQKEIKGQGQEDTREEIKVGRRKA